VVKHFGAYDFANFNEMKHFDIDISAYAADSTTHTLELVDTTPDNPTTDMDGYFGFAIDSIKITDWVV